jgi:hypothetical protein
MYVDELIRIRLPQIRARFRPSEFERLRAVRIAVGVHVCSVRIESVASSGCFGARRRWMICPRCARRTSVVAFDAASGWLGCRGCLRYRSRPRAVPAPHTRGDVHFEGSRTEEVFNEP